VYDSAHAHTYVHQPRRNMNLNIFKRIADLEAAQKQVDYQINVLKMAAQQHNSWIKEFEATKQTDADKIAKRRAYSRAYYLKNKGKKGKLKCSPESAISSPAASDLQTATTSVSG